MKLIRNKKALMVHILYVDGRNVGLLRYNLFWDNTPFCTMLFIDGSKQKNGYGRMLMQHWEREMKERGYGMVMTSTQVDEEAQHFYRKPGYKECGGFIVDIPGYEQPMKIIIIRHGKVKHIWKKN